MSKGHAQIARALAGLLSWIPQLRNKENKGSGLTPCSLTSPSGTATLQIMSTITFDTLKFAERLEKAGMPREQAIAMIEVQKESLSEVMDAQIATKSDILEVRADMVRLDRRIDGIDAEIKLLKWMVGLSLALSTGMIALLLRIAFTLPH
jgi:hypothetical protein